jgi:imidazole glycerol-phosphate synthase subunit HisH
MIAIVDYGVGNLASVRNAFHRIGALAELHSDPSMIASAERLILPGVGSFRVAMETLASRGWVSALQDYARSGRPFLGICLGMQLLFDRSEEHGPTEGLALVPGDVVRLEPLPPHKVPHVGWNGLTPTKPHPLLSRIKPSVDFYFVHSYHCVPKNKADVLGTCDFGGPFVAAVASGNVAGMQFHPEKSQPAGIQILENFLEWDPAC